MPFHLALHPAARLERTDAALVLRHWGQRCTFDQPSPGVARALDVLANGGAAEDTLDALVVDTDGPGFLPHWVHTLDVVRDAGALQYTQRHGGRDFAVLQAAAPGRHTHPTNLPPDAEVALSRFAYVNAVEGTLLLASPQSLVTVHLCEPLAAAALALLRTPSRAMDVVHALPTLAPGTVADFVALLAAAGMLADAGSGDAAVDQWGFADLLFHWRSRWGRQALPTGGTFPQRGRSAPLPAVKPPMAGTVIELVRPDLRQAEATDPPFSEVLEARRSVRSYGNTPLTLDQLTTFLFRVARVRRVMDANADMPYAISERPYPSGGACYPLEIYPVVARCDGIERGMYHYDPLGHRLTRIHEWDDRVATLASDARLADGPGTPHVLLVVTARFRRVMWKYEGMAYATVLKDVGVLYQTMYLVATAIGLAPCALGCGNTETFAAITGLDPCEESSVGEFLLGSRAPHA